MVALEGKKIKNRRFEVLEIFSNCILPQRLGLIGNQYAENVCTSPTQSGHKQTKTLGLSLREAVENCSRAEATYYHLVVFLPRQLSQGGRAGKGREEEESSEAVMSRSGLRLSRGEGHQGMKESLSTRA